MYASGQFGNAGAGVGAALQNMRGQVAGGAGLPPRLQAAVAAGRMDPAQAASRFQQFQQGGLPGQGGGATPPIMLMSGAGGGPQTKPMDVPGGVDQIQTLTGGGVDQMQSLTGGGLQANMMGPDGPSVSPYGKPPMGIDPQPGANPPPPESIGSVSMGGLQPKIDAGGGAQPPASLGLPMRLPMRLEDAMAARGGGSSPYGQIRPVGPTVSSPMMPPGAGPTNQTGGGLQGPPQGGGGGVGGAMGATPPPPPGKGDGPSSGVWGGGGGSGGGRGIMGVRGGGGGGAKGRLDATRGVLRNALKPRSGGMNKPGLSGM